MEIVEDSHSIVTVASFVDPSLAYLAMARLDFEGIPSWVADDAFINLNRALSIALGGVKLNVRRSDFEDARKALDADCSDELESVAFPGSESQDSCPICESHRLVYINWTSKAAALSLLTGLPLIFFYKRMKCLD